MAELPPLKENKYWKGVFAVVGIMSTLVIYGVLQLDGSYTIRTFGALTFATIMTTSDKTQLVSILLSCIWFAHPLRWEQCIGAVSLSLSLSLNPILFIPRFCSCTNRVSSIRLLFLVPFMWKASSIINLGNLHIQNIPKMESLVP